jgi:hypothetical protein
VPNAKQKSLLLELINGRKAWDDKGPTPRGFPFTPKADEVVAVANAVTAHGRANDSDPFASTRIVLYIERGYEEYHEVFRLAKSQIALRDREPKGQFAPLARIKKSLDIDAAWERHRQ